MKKYLISSFILLAILIPLIVWGWGAVMTGGMVPAAAGGCCGTDCSLLGTEELCWDGEHDTSTVTGCVSGTTITGVLNDITIDTTQNHTPGGENSLTHDTANHHFDFTVTGKDIFDTAAGFIALWLYPTGSPEAGFFEAYVDSDDKFYLKLESDLTIDFQHEGNNSQVWVTSTDTLTLNQWNLVEARWSAALNKIGLRINSGEWLDDEDASAVTAFATSEPATIELGEYYGGFSAGTIYIDDVKIWVTYDQT